MPIDVVDRSPVAAPLEARAVILVRLRAILPHGPSRPEGDPPQDLVAVEHGGDAILEDHGDRLAPVLSADGALVGAELDVAAPVEAAGADLPPRAGGEVDAAVAQEREVQLASGTGTGG